MKTGKEADPMTKRIFTWFLTLCLLLTACLTAQAQSVAVVEIQKYGNLVLSISGTEFLESGIAYGDIVTVSIGDTSYDMPVCTNYSDVDEGSAVCRVLVDEASRTDAVVLAVNMGELASQAGIAVKTHLAEEPGYRWDYSVASPVEVQIFLKEPAGYLDQYMLRQLSRTNERADYAHLTDAQFANFRAVNTTGMETGVLYRSSSPIDPELGRSAYADAAMREAGVSTVLNLADSLEGMETHPGWMDSYYAGCEIIALNLGVDVTTDDFQHGLAEGLRFLMTHEGPYLVHCTEGKDRAGFVNALLECLMGADAAEVTADYMTTYANYYGVQPDSEQYQLIAQSNIQKLLKSAFGVDDLASAQLGVEAAEYMRLELDLSEEEIDQLKQKLAGN